MINAQLEIIIIASITAIACAIPGTFLVMRKMTMLADAISHSILLGIILAFFAVKTLDSPLLVLAAGITGVITVFLVESLIKSKLVKEDTAIGVVFPFMFSIAIILIALFASQIHIDTDSVLMGELAFAPLNRMEINGIDFGPMAYYQIGSMMLVNILLTVIFFKEIKLSLFDENYATAIGFNPKAVQYMLMVFVSFTTVTAFEVVGSIMVVGLIVGPAVVALFFTKRLWTTLALAPIVGVVASLLGYSVSHWLDVSIAGSIASMIGVLFMLALFFAPRTGVISKMRHKKTVRVNFALNMLLVHLLQHETIGNAREENYTETISLHFNWNEEFTNQIISAGRSKHYISVTDDGFVRLENSGIRQAKMAIEK